MDIDWEAIIWFVIWAAVIIAGLWLIIWVTVASIAAKNFKRVSRDIDKSFETPFFKNARRRL